jgi:hypothetical protein
VRSQRYAMTRYLVTRWLPEWIPLTADARNPHLCHRHDLAPCPQSHVRIYSSVPTYLSWSRAGRPPTSPGVGSRGVHGVILVEIFPRGVLRLDVTGGNSEGSWAIFSVDTKVYLSSGLSLVAEAGLSRAACLTRRAPLPFFRGESFVLLASMSNMSFNWSRVAAKMGDKTTRASEEQQ